MSSAEGTYECEECETSYSSKEELDKQWRRTSWGMITQTNTIKGNWSCSNSRSSQLFLISSLLSYRISLVSQQQLHEGRSLDNTIVINQVLESHKNNNIFFNSYSFSTFCIGNFLREDT